MREQMIKIYKFDELSDIAKGRVLELHHHTNVDHGWWEDEYEYLKTEMSAVGYDIDEICFSGFWSQGDGASWIGKINVLNWLLSTDDAKERFKDVVAYLEAINENECNVMVSRSSSSYCHENTMVFDHDLNEVIEDLPEAMNVSVFMITDMERLMRELECSAKDVARTIYSTLEKTYYSLVSDENVGNTVQINEYEFLEDGTPWFLS